MASLIARTTRSVHLSTPIPQHLKEFLAFFPSSSSIHRLSYHRIQILPLWPQTAFPVHRLFTVMWEDRLIRHLVDGFTEPLPNKISLNDAPRAVWNNFSPMVSGCLYLDRLSYPSSQVRMPELPHEGTPA